MNLIKINWSTIWIGLLFILVLSCKKTDNYYQALIDQPELFKNYELVYSVGDTMLIHGRFNDSELRIDIGNFEAKILKIEKREYLVDHGFKDSIQLVSILITKEMGVGTNRKIKITSSKISIDAPSIEIIEDSESGVLSGKLTVTKIADYPVDSDPVYCRNGKGNLYFLHKANFTVTRINATGEMLNVFDPSSLKDKDGKPFTFSRLNGLGIDPNERYLYLSLFTQATGSQENHIYRLIRYDVENKTTEVLNKTFYSRLASKRTLQAAQPFEGNINEIKMYMATGIYPDSKGNLYFDMNGHFITKLTHDGYYSYVFKSNNVNNSEDLAPQIYDPNLEQYYSNSRGLQFFPGVQLIDYLVQNKIIFNPDFHEYWTKDLLRIDLERQVYINSLNGTGKMGKNSTPYISGSFDVLTNASYYNDRWGQLPIGKGKMLILWYKDLDKANFPAWGVVDYELKRGYRYAPGAFDNKGYKTTASDLLLEYDAEGMLYMTANNKSIILKTSYQ